MNTPHVTIRLGALLSHFLDDAPPVGDESVAGGRKRHDTPFSFDVVFQPSADDTPPSEVERDGKGRHTTPFTFEITAPGLSSVVVESKRHRIDTQFQFERGVPPTDGGLMLAAIREAVEVALGVSTPPHGDRGKGRTHTAFVFEISAGGGKASAVSVCVIGDGGA